MPPWLNNCPPAHLEPTHTLCGWAGIGNSGIGKLTLNVLGSSLSTEMAFTFIYINIYRKPSAKPEFYDQLKNLLHSFDFKKEVILMGDFNVNWSDKSGRKKLKNITDYLNLTKIDLLFTNRPEIITKTFNIMTGLSDHNIILFGRKLKNNIINHFHSSATPVCKYESVPISQQENLGVALREIEWDGVLSKGDLESDCDQFTSTIKKVMGPYLRKLSQKKTLYLVQSCLHCI